MLTTYFLNMLAGNAMHTTDATSFPTTYYVALSTVVPGDNGSGFSEPSGGSYARSAISSMSTPSGGSTSNSLDIEFTEATAAWGTIKAFGVYDSGTSGSGNLLFWDTVSPEQAIVEGNQARFKPGQLKLTFQNVASGN